MKWRTWMSSAALALAVCGCQPEYRSPAQSGLPLEPSAYFPHDQPSITRAQKPEGSTQAITPVSMAVNSARVGEVNARIWATVNGTPILESELRHSLFLEILRLGNDPNYKQKLVELYAKQLEILIDNELLIQELNAQFDKNPAGKRTLDKLEEEADKEFDKFQLWLRRDVFHVATDDELKSILARSDFSLEGLRRQQQRGLMAVEYVQFLASTAVAQIGHRQIYDYYQEHKDEFTPQSDTYEWEDIFLDFAKYPDQDLAIRKATEIAWELQKGAKVKDFLQFDDGDSHSRNGRGSGSHPGEIQPPEVEPELARLKSGEVGRLVKLQTGIHIVRLVHKDNAHELQPFDGKVQKLIRDKIRREVIDRERKRALDELRHKALIEITKPEK